MTFFNINDLLDELYFDFKQKIIKDNIGIEFIKQDNNSLAFPFILSDKTRVYQIIDNFIDNAIKNTKQGFIEFGYSFDYEGDNKIIFYVKDTGCGIKKENFEIIFDRFRQISTGHNRAIQGNGLGLAICRGLAEALNGKI
ncbi:MAG: hypothetical protein Kow0068_10420 [Marinilabiliales bacterium]